MPGAAGLHSPRHHSIQQRQVYATMHTVRAVKMLWPYRQFEPVHPFSITAEVNIQQLVKARHSRLRRRSIEGHACAVGSLHITSATSSGYRYCSSVWQKNRRVWASPGCHAHSAPYQSPPHTRTRHRAWPWRFRRWQAYPG